VWRAPDSLANAGEYGQTNAAPRSPREILQQNSFHAFAGPQSAEAARLSSIFGRDNDPMEPVILSQ
jgi:hypothetical protein